MNQNQGLGNRLLRLPAVTNKTGKKRSSIYLMIAHGEFPKPIKIGKRSSAWVEHEVDEWIQQRIQNR